jgi:hypothetical protein
MLKRTTYGRTSFQLLRAAPCMPHDIVTTARKVQENQILIASRAK